MSGMSRPSAWNLAEQIGVLGSENIWSFGILTAGQPTPSRITGLVCLIVFKKNNKEKTTWPPLVTECPFFSSGHFRLRQQRLTGVHRVDIGGPHRDPNIRQYSVQHGLDGLYCSSCSASPSSTLRQFIDFQAVRLRPDVYNSSAIVWCGSLVSERLVSVRLISHFVVYLENNVSNSYLSDSS